MRPSLLYLPALPTVALVFFLAAEAAPAADCPQFGGSSLRNNVSSAKGLPAAWSVGDFDAKTNAWKKGSGKGILWVSPLGSQSYGTPVVAGGKVFCATNNGAGYLKRYPSKVDLGCLLAFQQSDGKFLWQFSVPKHPAGRAVDWPEQGICSAPLVEGDRLWVVTNRGEVACLKTDAPGKDEPDVVWTYDMMRELGSMQHNMASCSVTALGDALFVETSNGVDESHKQMPAPKAASFIALDKRSGKLLWSDASPGENVLHGQWGSPACGMLGGVAQVIFPGGDGWLYSFRADRGKDGKPELLWKFDCNPKAAAWKENGRGDRNEIIATPVIADGAVYVATGQDPEYGEGPGILWCIDPTKRGDVSPELVVDKAGKPVPPRRLQQVDAASGESVRPNPNSAELWRYAGHDANGDGKLDFAETMHRSIGMAAVADGLVVAADFCGLVHCLDAKTGKFHWSYDMMAACWGSPLVADGKIYIGDEDGDMAVFELSAKRKLLSENNMQSAVYSSAVAVDGVLYIATRDRLFAIGGQAD